MMLRLDKLTVGYSKKAVVSDINAALLKGQFICLLGPNGSGKSTILKTIVRMLDPLGGEVYINDAQITKMSSQDIARTTAVVLTDRISPGLLTAYDIVMLGRHPHTGFTGKPTSNDKWKVMDALRMVNAEDIAQRYFDELSDGEKQKTMLARALAQEPQLIVLDEPTSHLDARHRIEVMLILRQLTQEKGVTVLASMHEVDLAMKVCDVAILVKDNRVLAGGTPEDVLNEKLVAELYGMQKASFSGLLGGIELKGSNSGTPVLVVGGGGSGVGVYRALTKHRISISTGILFENDIDFYVARTVGADIVSAAAFEEIREDIYNMACVAIDAATQVIDSGFPVGSGNRLNVDLINYALGKGKTVHTFRTQREAGTLLVDTAKKLVYSAGYFELMSAVKHFII
jgi:iron complex transport system ATP-binding protein